MVNADPGKDQGPCSRRLRDRQSEEEEIPGPGRAKFVVV
jgi:hypothetical protein